MNQHTYNPFKYAAMAAWNELTKPAAKWWYQEQLQLAWTNFIDICLFVVALGENFRLWVILRMMQPLPPKQPFLLAAAPVNPEPIAEPVTATITVKKPAAKRTRAKTKSKVSV